MSQSIVVTPEFDEESGTAPKRFEVAQPDSNLEVPTTEADGFRNLNSPQRLLQPNTVLETAPSFSVFNSSGENDKEGGEGDGWYRTLTIGEEGDESSSIFDGAVETPHLYLAMGLGIDVCDTASALIDNEMNRDSDFKQESSDRATDETDIESYYKRMIEENPFNALFLKNYALFLYQSKGDLEGAEVYFSRAILIEPANAEIFSQYAKFIWEWHHDLVRASSYFKQAVQAAPNDSFVLAAYASFLWETEDEEEEEEEENGQFQVPQETPIPHGAMARAIA